MRPTTQRTFDTTEAQRVAICEVLGLEPAATVAILVEPLSVTVTELEPKRQESITR